MADELDSISSEQQPPAATEPQEQPPAATEPREQPPAAGSHADALLKAASRRRVKWMSAGLAAVVIFGIMAFMAYQTFTQRLESVRAIDAATKLIEDADVIVVQVDTVVRSEVTSTLAESARAAAAQVPDAANQLEEAIVLLEQTTEGTTLEDEKRGSDLLAAVEARRDMMEQAPTILRLNQSASEALVPAREGWDALVSADQKSDRAVAEYNLLTKAGVRASRQINREAAAELATARDKFALAERLFPEAPFDQYLAYVDLRLALNRLSQQSDAAWLDGSLKRANALIRQYNDQETAAIERAKTLPETPEKAIADAYEAAAFRATEAYYRARDAATDADRQLRE